MEQTPNKDKKWWILTAIGIGTFMSALDGSVVNTNLPIIGRSFSKDIAAVEWIVTIYLLILSGLLLSFGRLGDIRGHRSIYIFGFFIFLISSALCGLSSNLNTLIGFRAIQALGAAMLSANSPAILTKNFPASQRGQALGIQATMTYLGLTLGPSLGGWLAEIISWRMIFYINIPVGLVALFLSLRYIPHDRREVSDTHFDWIGAVLFVTGLIFLLLGLNQAHAYGWASIPILFLLGTAIALIVTFIIHENRSSNPMLDLSLFSSKRFSNSVISAIFNYMCVYIILFVLPFYFIQARQFSPTTTGLVLTTMPITMAIVAPLSGTLSDRIGTRLLTTLGMFIQSLGLLLLSRLGPQSAMSSIILALSISGLGIGIFISPNTSALLGSAPKDRQGIAAGVLATSRNLGMVLGVGLAGAIVTTVIVSLDVSQSSGLYVGIQTSLLVASGIAGLGMLISALYYRPARKPT